MLLGLVLLTSPCSAQQLFFQTPRAGSCTTDGHREYSAIIDGRGYSGDWVRACEVTKAVIAGHEVASRNCGWSWGRVWGQFDVPDSSCAVSLYFETPRPGQCLPSGAREFAAIINGTNFDGDWVEACRQTSATIYGMTLSAHHCAWNGGRVWGKFDAPDNTCATRVRGRVRYQDYGGQFAQAGPRSLPPIKVRPVRRGLVEIWFGSGLSRTKRVVRTAEDGTFDTFVPAFDRANYRVVVIASNDAGQANFKDNTATWYWTREFMLQNHPDGQGFVVDASITDPDEAMAFNAADVILVAYDYALSHGIPASRLNRVSVVPQSSPLFGARTAPSFATSLIWLPVDRNDVNSMFQDATILHEYAHHLERMNDTYALWPAVHDGCSANFVRDVASDEFAWFEGFPNYFRVVVGRSSQTVNGVRKWASHAPSANHNAPQDTPTCEAAAMPPAGPVAVEDYVASLLLDLVAEKNVAAPNGKTVLTQDELEKHVLRLWFNDLKTVRTPGNGMPRVSDFQSVWNRAFPRSQVLDRLIADYGM